MGVWADDRAQSIQVGAILLFGILILAFVGYQATVVPNQNAGVEAAHSQDAQADMLDVRNAILSTAATGDSRPASVDLGPSYPARAMFVNPGPPAGTLETVELSESGSNEIRITHAEALDEEAADYWTGDPSVPRSYQTRGIQYVPQYNVYQNAPTTVYENSVLYNRFRRAAVSDDASTVDDNVAATNSGQSLVNGRTITLVAVRGDRDTSSTESVSVDASVVSGPMKTVAVTDSGSPITIQVPTQLSADTWERLLEDQPYVDESTISVSNGVLSFELQAGETYNLRLGGVALGSSPNPAVPTYSVAVSGDGASVAPGGTTEFVVEVRDQFNNPVSGVEVAPQSVSDGSVAPSPATTDEDGRATFTYTAPSNTGPQQVVVGFDGESDPTAPKAVEFEFNVGSTGGGGGGDSEGPRITDVDAEPNPVSDGDPAELSGTASDTGYGGTDVIAIEWFRADPGESAEDADPGTGNGNGLSAGDGEFNQPTESFSEEIGTNSWPTGLNTLYVRAQDGNGNWGPTESVTVEVEDSGLRYVPGSGEATGPGGRTTGIAFDIENLGNEDVEVTEFRIDSTTAGATHVGEFDSGEGQFDHEVFIHAQGSVNQDQSRDGFLEAWFGYYEIGTRVSLTDTATIRSGNNNNDATVYVYEFLDGSSGGSDPVSMDNEEITITLYYQASGGPTESITFTVET